MYTQIMKQIIKVLSINLLCLFGMVAQVHALPPNFQDEPVLTGLNQPLNLAVLPDGRMLVLLKGGEIRIFDPATIPATSSNYLTITDIESGEERGLASIALDPDFAVNNYFYVYYTHGSSSRNRISRFTHNGNSADLASEFMIWQDNENWSDCCHYGGGLDFGPDGKLYLTTGEEFDGNQAQDLTRAGGKIIRINNDGSIPNDNPFVDGPGGNLDEIWAYGLRNPYRAHWDILGNRFYIGEVGGNVQTTAWEDIHIGQAGANYGWPFCEGNCTDPAYSDPVYTYPHEPGEVINGFEWGGAVTAGFVYRGSMFPSEYYGTFFLADYVLGWMRNLKFDGSGQVISATEFSNTVNNVVSLVEGPEGALYYTDIYGQVRRIVYTSGNQPPTITSAITVPASGSAPLNVTLSVIASDLENDPLSYHWIFGDGSEADGGASIAHTYQEGIYTAYVQVSDGSKISLSEPIEIQSGNPPQVQILTPVFGDLFQALDIINYSGSATDPDETLPESSYSWTIRFLHNGHTHPVLNESIGSSGSVQVNDSGHDYFDSTGFELILTVTDSAGLTGTDIVEIYPDKVNLNLSTSPPGLGIFLDGLSQNTPLIYDSMIGFRHTVSAPVSYCDVATNTGYAFSSWSDGGTQTHEITVPSVDMDLVANFVVTGSCVGLVTSGLSLHLEADQGLQLNGNSVIGWTDQSGFGNDLLSFGDPQIVAAADLNNQLVVDFNGVNDKLERTLALTGLPAGNNDRTIIMLAKYRGVGFGGFAYGAASCNQVFGAIVDNVGNLAAQGWCTQNDYASAEIGTGAGWLIQSTVHEAGVMKQYKDGVLLDTQSHSYNTQLTRMVLGGELADNQFMDMQVAAVLVYDRALSASEQQLVQTYLTDKYYPAAEVSITTNSLGDGAVNVPYSATLTATGGVQPYTWSVASGALPQGITLDAVTGVLSGMPTTPQTANFTVSASDSAGSSAASGVMLLTIRDGTGATPATIIITSPAEGATVTGSDVLVEYSLIGTGYDHFHISMDGGPYTAVHMLTGSYLLSNVTAGIHAITVQLVNAEHTPLSNPEANYTVNITVEAIPNVPPVAADDAGVLGTGASLAIAVLSNDSDADGLLNTASVTVVTPPANGALLDDGAGVLTYTHNGSATTSDSFTYTVLDDQGAVSNVATVSLLIGAQPVTNGLVFRLEPDAGLVTSGSTVTGWNDQSGLGNDLVSAGTPQLVTAADLSNHLVVDFNGVNDKLERTGGLSGLPTGNANRTVYIVAKYRGVGFGGFAYGQASCNGVFGAIVDNVGNLAAQGWCTQNDYASTEIGTGAGWLIQSIVHEAGVMKHYKNGVLLDTQNHSYNTQLTKLVLGGELADNQFMDMQVAAVMVYSRALSAQEQTQMQNALQSKYFGSGGTGNALPLAANDSATVGLANSVAIAVLANDSDIDGFLNTGSVVIGSAPVNGSLLDDGAGVLTYTHNGSATASDSFTYSVSDDQGGVSNTATVSITITGVNQAPVAVDDTGTVAVGASIAIAVLNNDSDADGLLNTASVTVVMPPANGTVLGDGTGVLTYTHNGSATSSDSFTYTVLDDQGAVSNVATVSLLVGAQPVTSGLVFRLEPDAGLVTSGSTVTGWNDQSGLGNDLISAGSPQLVAAADLNNHLVVDFNGVNDKLERTGVLSGLPTGNANRTVYLVAKYRGIGFGGFAYGNASCNQVFGIIVDNVGNLAAQGWCPQHDYASASVGTGSGWLIQSIVHEAGVMKHYKDGVQVDTQNHSYNTQLTKLVLGGELADNQFMDMQVAAVMVYNRALSAQEQTQMQNALQSKYFGSGGTGNALPLAANDSATVGLANSVAIAVLANDSDIDGFLNTGSVVIGSAPVNGSLLDDGAGVLTYTHNGSATASDSFTYNVSDDQGGVSNTATVSITITGVNQAPVAVDDTGTVAVGASIAIAVLNNDSDVDGLLNAASVTVVIPPANGTVLGDGAGVLTYTHNGGATSSDSFTYTVLDDQGVVSNVATVSLLVGAQPVTNGLVFRLEPDAGLVTSGSTVTGWNDQSGLGNDLVSAGTPQLVAAVDLNNHLVVDFNGVNDKLERVGGLSGLPTGNANRTVYLVAKYRGVGFGGFAYGNASCNQVFGTIVDNVGNLAAQGWCPQHDYASAAVGTGSGWLIQSVVHEAGVMKHYKDGVLLDTQSHSYNTQLTKLVLGGELADNQFMDMQVAAVMVYDRALTALEQQQMIVYLQAQYGL